MADEKKVVAGLPRKPVMYSFRVLESFWSDETNSQYLQDYLYHVREGNEKLHALVQQWAAEGKVSV